MKCPNGLVCVAVVVAWMFPAASEASDYVRGELLVDPAALAAAAAEGWVILDARPNAAYLAGHIPAARWVDASEWAKGFGKGDDTTGWSKRISDLGIKNDSKVVIYDAVDSKDAARIWWILRYWGVIDARLLNGGWQAWQSANLAVDSVASTHTATDFKAKPRSARLATKEQLLAAIRLGNLQIVDSRSEKEHCGVNKLTNKQGGAIPGSRHLDWVDLIDAKTHRFKPAAELRRMFADVGIDPNQPSATYCQSGGRASVMAFALELMGGEEVSNYYSSWSEWGNADDTPVVINPPKAKPTTAPAR